jgi:hypothetical protein
MLRYASGLKKRPEHLLLPRFTVGILLELSKWNTLKKLEILDWDLKGSGALIGEQPMLDDQSVMAIVFYSCRLEHLRIPNIEWHNAFDDCVSQSLQFLECPAASFLPSRRSGRQQACSVLFPNLKHLVLSFDSEGYFNGVQDRLSDALKGSALDDLTLIFSGENINGSDDVTLAFFQKGCVKRLVVQDLSDKQFAGMMQHGIGSFEELVFSSRGPGPAQVWSCDDPNGGVWQFRNFEPASCAAEGSSCGTIAKPDDPGQRASA